MAYRMVDVYDTTENCNDARRIMEERYPDVHEKIIHGMWIAIDAYNKLGGKK
jgi:hypothetical protein